MGVRTDEWERKRDRCNNEKRGGNCALISRVFRDVSIERGNCGKQKANACIACVHARLYPTTVTLHASDNN